MIAKRLWIFALLSTLLAAGAVLVAHPEPHEEHGEKEKGPEQDEEHIEHIHRFELDQVPPEPKAPLGATTCVGGFAGIYPCSNVDLMAFMPLSSIGGGAGSDIWGWTDPLTGKEYALMGRSTGTSFVDISDPAHPVYLGNLPTHTVSSSWREIKAYANHALIVSDNSGAHGMQIFDLTQLRSVTNPPVTFTETVHYNQFGNCHNIVINEDTGFAYCVGSNTCSGGLHMINVQNPTAPAFAGCVSQDGYTHDAQCVIYHGPDIQYQGREICFNSNEDTLTVVDVTHKSAPVQLSRTTYPGEGYTHQGWLTEDHRYFLLDDELDEQSFGHNSRTRVWNVSDLNAPSVIGFYDGPTAAIDHNLFIVGNIAYEANYRAGLRILDITNVATASLTEVGYFDIYPANDNPSFNGAWGNYPFFQSGTVIVSGIGEGLFILRPTFGADFQLDVADAVLEVCDPGSAGTVVELTPHDGYMGSVTLSAEGVPAGAEVTFGANPVAVPGTSDLSVVTSGLAPGTYSVTVRGSDGSREHTRDVIVKAAAGLADMPQLVSPASGATGLATHPILTWNPAFQAFGYVVQVATDPAFASVVYGATTAGTTHQVVTPLARDAVHYWRVVPSNACGSGPASPGFSFRTAAAPPVLLVDDDDDAPDVRGDYATALATSGADYDVWDTIANGEPGPATLAPYAIVIWFTGDALGGTAGPGPGAETTLAAWLDGSGCLLVASQDYAFDRGLTAFMQNYLGTASFTNDVNQTLLKGRPPLFGSLGPYTISLPYTNRTDSLVPAATAGSAFNGSAGAAGVYRDAGVYRTMNWGFGLEAVATPANRRDVVAAFTAWCNALLSVDADGDGVPNGADCAPSNAGEWAAPSPSRDLTVTRDALDNLLWVAPADPGASAVLYDVLRSGDPASFLSATCVESDGPDAAATDVTEPAPGAVFGYLVRARNTCGGNLGTDSGGTPRLGAVCP